MTSGFVCNRSPRWSSTSRFGGRAARHGPARAPGDEASEWRHGGVRRVREGKRQREHAMRHGRADLVLAAPSTVFFCAGARDAVPPAEAPIAGLAPHDRDANRRRACPTISSRHRRTSSRAAIGPASLTNARKRSNALAQQPLPTPRAQTSWKRHSMAARLRALRFPAAHCPRLAASISRSANATRASTRLIRLPGRGLRVATRGAPHLARR
jgi:hypothetical protein